MRKLLLISFLFYISLISPCFGTTWYLQDTGACNMSACTWNSAAGGGGSALTWGSQADNDTFEMNGKTGGVTIDADPGGASVTVNLTNSTANSVTWSAAMPSSGNTLDIHANITAGVANGLTLSGSGTGTINIYGNITGSATTTGKYGCSDGRTAGTVNVTGNITGGTAINTIGWIKASDGGTLVINGNVTGGSSTGSGYSGNQAGIVTVNGNCQGGSSANLTAFGCVGNGYGTLTITGSIIQTAVAPGATGKFTWQPSSTSKYIKILNGGTPYYFTSNSSPAVTDVKSGVTYGWDGSAAYTGTLSSGGGGAWAF